jgi:hypothetical protein
MSKIGPAPEIIIDPTTLPNKTIDETVQQQLPKKVLPKHLADFKEYADSKLCYYSEPIEQAELVDVKSKVAYQCRMKVLMDQRKIRWSRETHNWNTQTVLGSSTIGKSNIVKMDYQILVERSWILS